MASGGVDPDEDVRLVVLPPPYMVDSLASGHVDGFCVGAPWNSVAVDMGVGNILHFGCEIMTRASEKGVGVARRAGWTRIGAFVASSFVPWPAGRFRNQGRQSHQRGAHIVAQRLGTNPELVVRTLTGNLKTAPDGIANPIDTSLSAVMTNRPDPVQAAWAYAQIVRWGQAPLSAELRARAERVFRADVYDAALGPLPAPSRDHAKAGIGTFVGPEFDADNIAGYLSAWRSMRPPSPAANHRSLILRLQIFRSLRRIWAANRWPRADRRNRVFA